MISIRRYSATDVFVWDEFVEASKNGTFMLKRGYMDYHADRFVDHSLLCYDDDALVALLPASEHGSELRSHGGLTYGGLITSKQILVQKELQIFAAIKEYLRENQFEKLVYKRVPSIYYHYPSDEDLYALYRMGAQLIRRDISSAIYMPDKIRFSERRRRGSKQAAKQGIIVRQSDDFTEYINLLYEILRKYHSTKPVHTASELELLANRFPDNIKLYAAFQENNMLAGVVVFETDKVAHAQYIANSDEGRKCGALDAVMDYLINILYVNKQYFDFGISTEREGLLLNEGLVMQKQEFGARGIVYDFYELNAVVLKLVPYCEVYLRKSIKWLNDSEIQQLIDSQVTVTPELQREWFTMISQDSTYQIWGIEYDGVPIGACGIKHIDYITKKGEYWGYIGEKEYWGGKGHLIFESIYQMAQKLGLMRLNLKVLKTNPRAIALYQKEGFIIERETDNELVMYKNI